MMKRNNDTKQMVDRRFHTANKKNNYGYDI